MLTCTSNKQQTVKESDVLLFSTQAAAVPCRMTVSFIQVANVNFGKMQTGFLEIRPDHLHKTALPRRQLTDIGLQNAAHIAALNFQDTLCMQA